VPFRVHARPDPKHKPSKYDFVSPWKSKPFEISSGQRACLKFRLALDPWQGDRGPVVPPVGPEPWRVTLTPAVDGTAGKTKGVRRRSGHRGGHR